MIDWKSPDKYLQLCNFDIKLKYMFLTNSYKIQENKNVSIFINWSCCDRLRFMQTLNDTK